jgi:pimeloyl-ACP methyl ester carboxylesterase
VLPFLHPHRDVLALDLPGFGGSSPLPAAPPHTPAMLAAAVERLLDELGLDRPQLAGHSLGGWVALELREHWLNAPVRRPQRRSQVDLAHHGDPARRTRPGPLAPAAAPGYRPGQRPRRRPILSSTTADQLGRPAALG